MPADAESVLREAIRSGLRPDPRLTVHDWADRHRWLPQQSSAEHGKWRTKRTPYLQEIMDCLSTTHPATEITFMKGAQVGAPLSLKTEVPTPDGWKVLGDIKAGDHVLAPDGQPTEVLGLSPVFHGRTCYRVTFSDGTEVVADGGHRWAVIDSKAKGGEHKTLTTEEMLAGGVKFRGKRFRYGVDATAPVEHEPKNLPVDPYFLGAWLGDGHSYSPNITQHVFDAGEMAETLARRGLRVLYRKNQAGCPDNVSLTVNPEYRAGRFCQRGHDMRRGGKRNGRCRLCANERANRASCGAEVSPTTRPRKSMHRDLSVLGVIGNKHVPEQYKTASYSQRLEVVRGMMDTDGSVTEKGLCEFFTSSGRLAEDFREMVASLGYVARVRQRQAYGGGFKHGRGQSRQVMHTVYFTAYAERNVFRLGRKASRLRSMSNPKTIPGKTLHRRIVDIQPVESEPVRCIKVAHPSHLFLVSRSYIATHNTESGNNWIGYVIDSAPGPMLAVQPTVELAKRMSKQRLDPMLSASRRLADKVAEKRSRDGGNTVQSKDFPGGVLILTGANSAVGLRSMPAKYLFLDEVDAYPGDVDEEGDPINLAQARTRTFGSRKKVFKVSTPTIEGRSKIAAAYEDSDQRLYYLPCPHCYHDQPLRWQNLRWEDGKPETAVYHCEGCGVAIEEWQKTWMLENGEWVAQNPGNPKAGFHLSALYSPVGWYSWADIAEAWEAAQGRQDKLREFINTVLGETWRERGEAPDWEKLYAKREEYQIGVVPAGGLVLTLGSDVQPDRIECEVVAWGPGMESWSVDYIVIPGDTATEEPWRELDKVVGRQYEREDGGAPMPIRLAAIDARYQTQTVFNYCRRQPHHTIPVQGNESQPSIVGQPTAADVTTRGKKKVRRGVKRWPVGVDVAKREFYGWLRQPMPTEEDGEVPYGYCHFPEYGPEYFKQLTAEQVVARIVRGYRKYQWEKTRERNEALDCRIYARAAAFIVGIDRWQDKDWDALAQQVKTSPAKPEGGGGGTRWAPPSRPKQNTDPYL